MKLIIIAMALAVWAVVALFCGYHLGEYPRAVQTTAWFTIFGAATLVQCAQRQSVRDIGRTCVFQPVNVRRLQGRRQADDFDRETTNGTAVAIGVQYRRAETRLTAQTARRLVADMGIRH